MLLSILHNRQEPSHTPRTPRTVIPQKGHPMAKSRNTGLPKINQLPSGAYHAKAYDYTDETGKRIYRSFSNYDYNKLLLELAQFKQAKSDDKLARATGNRSLTLGDAIDSYIKSKSAVLSPTTMNSYRSLRRNNLQYLMDIPVDKITQENVQQEINREAMTHAPKTVRNIHGLLTAVLQVYRPDLTLHTRLPQKVKNEIAIPTEEEVQKLIKLSKDTDMELPILLAACCGMRRSEIAALKWSDINFKNNTITIKHALVINGDNQFVEKTTKTTAGTRTIRMFPIVSNALKSYKNENKKGDGEYITINPDAISRAFARLEKKAEIPHYRFHDLRHYTVSVMLSLNIPKNYIADYVGHETENMIDQVYGHIMKNKKTAVEDIMQDYFSKIFTE